MRYRAKCPRWVYDRRKETMNKDGILHESEPFCDEGMMPSSIVLREHEHNQYVTHVKIYPNESVDSRDTELKRRGENGV